MNEIFTLTGIYLSILAADSLLLRFDSILLQNSRYFIYFAPGGYGIKEFFHLIEVMGSRV